jgi:hypothetical protein
MQIVNEHDGWLQSAHYVQIVNTVDDSIIIKLLRDAVMSLQDEAVIIGIHIFYNDDGIFCHSKLHLYKSSTSGNYLLVRDSFEGPVEMFFENVCKVLSQSMTLLSRDGNPWTYRKLGFLLTDNYEDEFSPVEKLVKEGYAVTLSDVTKIRKLSLPLSERAVDALTNIVNSLTKFDVVSPFSGEYTYHGVMPRTEMCKVLTIGEYLIINEDINNLNEATLLFYKMWEHGIRHILDFKITYSESRYNSFSTLQECVESLIGDCAIPKFRSMRGMFIRREALKILLNMNVSGKGSM